MTGAGTVAQVGRRRPSRRLKLGEPRHHRSDGHPVSVEDAVARPRVTRGHQAADLGDDHRRQFSRRVRRGAMNRGV